MTPFKLARLSLSRHFFSTTITVIAIALCVACAGTLLRLHQLSESRFSTMAQAGDAIVGAKAGGIEILLGSLNGEGDYPDFLPFALFESLRAQRSLPSSPIESITPFVYFAKFGEHRVVGTDDSFFQNKRANRALRFAVGEWENQLERVVVGSLVAKKNQLNVGDLVQVSPWLNQEPLNKKLNLRVSGILETTGTQWDRTLFASVDQAHQTLEENLSVIAKSSIWGSQVLHYFLVDLYPSGFEPLEALVNRRTVGQVIQVGEQKERLKDLSGVGQSVGLFVTAFVILLGGLAVCSMLVTRFEGMSLQLAVLRALGYTKKEISRWLLWEGLLLGVMGVVLGALIDAIGFPTLRSLLGTALPPPDLVSSSILDSAMIWLIAIAATVGSVLVPVIRMTKQDAHRSLRGL